MKPSTTEMTQIKSDENVGPSFLERQLQADAAKRAAQVLKKSSDTHPPQRPEDLPPVPEHSDGEINQLSTWSLLDDESSDDLHEPDHQTTVSDRRRPPKLPPKRQPESMTDTTSSHRSQESRDIEDDIKDLKKIDDCSLKKIKSKRRRFGISRRNVFSYRRLPVSISKTTIVIVMRARRSGSYERNFTSTSSIRRIISRT